jgi:hypothetical protein
LDICLPFVLYNGGSKGALHTQFIRMQQHSAAVISEISSLSSSMVFFFFCKRETHLDFAPRDYLLRHFSTQNFFFIYSSLNLNFNPFENICTPIKIGKTYYEIV